jgi:hypothetical protein
MAGVGTPSEERRSRWRRNVKGLETSVGASSARSVRYFVLISVSGRMANVATQTRNPLQSYSEGEPKLERG